MPMTEVAMAAGIGSLGDSTKHFATCFIALSARYAERIPRGSKRRTSPFGSRPPTLRLGVHARLPERARAVPSVEIVDGGRQLRTVEENGFAGGLDAKVHLLGLEKSKIQLTKCQEEILIR